MGFSSFLRHLHLKHFGKEKNKSKDVKNKAFESDTRYILTPYTRGYCLILTEKTVNETNITALRREGNEKDAKRLEEVFKALGLEVIKSELDEKGMVEKVEEYTKKNQVKNQDLFVCVVISNEGNGVLDAVEDIKDVLCNCSNLKGKPKIMIIEACRGDKIDFGVNIDACNSNNPEILNPESAIVHEAAVRPAPYVRRDRRMPSTPAKDLLISYSTVHEYKSNRNSDGTSWFLNSLCDVVTNHINGTEIIDILRLVDREVAKKEGENGELQTTQFEVHCFTKNLFLNQTAE